MATIIGFAGAVLVAIVAARFVGRRLARGSIAYVRWAVKAGRTCKHEKCTAPATAGNSYCSWEHERDALFLTDADRHPTPAGPSTRGERVLLACFLGGSVVAIVGLSVWLAIA